MPTSKTFTTTLVFNGSGGTIPLPFDPKPVFGRTRVPVRVTLNGYTFASTIASMGHGPFIPLRRSHREAAGLEGRETLRVRLDVDDQPRVVSVPADLRAALRAVPAGWERWQALSYTHQREHVEAIEGAKKPETRARRIEAAVRMVTSKPAAATKRPSAVSAKPAGPVNASRAPRNRG